MSEHRHSIEVRHIGIDAGTCRLGDRHDGCCPGALGCDMPGGTRPLVIIGVHGGLAQWEIVKPGVGMPRLHILDYDREGAMDWELTDLADEIQAARDELAEYPDTDPVVLANLSESIVEYRERVAGAWRGSR